MNKQEVIRKLQSVGKEVFVRFYELFKSYSNGTISKQDCIDYLVEQHISNANGAAIRCSNAKAIFINQKEFEALEIIMRSRIPQNIKNLIDNIIK